MEQKKQEQLEQKVVDLLRGIIRLRYQNAFLRLLLSLLKLRKARKIPYATAMGRVFRKVEESIFPKKIPEWQKRAIERCRMIALGTFSKYSDEEVKDAIEILTSFLPYEYINVRDFIAKGLQKRVSDSFDFFEEMRDENEWINWAIKDARAMMCINSFKVFLFKKEENTIPRLFRAMMKKYFLSHHFSSVFSTRDYIIAERYGQSVVVLFTVQDHYFSVSIEEHAMVSI